jgi:hypothetical protein
MILAQIVFYGPFFNALSVHGPSHKAPAICHTASGLNAENAENAERSL